MNYFISYIFMMTLFSFVLLILSITLGNRFNSSRSKSSPFECGFDPKDSARLPFSLRFFLLAVVFLIFDIEIALLFPTILGMSLGHILSSTIAATLFLFILLLGIWHEWNQGSLSWVI